MPTLVPKLRRTSLMALASLLLAGCGSNSSTEMDTKLAAAQQAADRAVQAAEAAEQAAAEARAHAAPDTVFAEPDAEPQPDEDPTPLPETSEVDNSTSDSPRMPPV